MRFDWRRFCETNHIPFVERGPNTARNNISIQCPWCGSTDTGNHMGLSLDKNAPVWGCFRNAAHRGKSPVFIIAKLLNITFKQAASFVENKAQLVDDFDSVVSRMTNEEQATPATATKETPLKELPREFRDLADKTRTFKYRQQFINYLAVERGFGLAAAEDIAKNYFLYYAITGDQAWRLIFTVPGGWTGRAIGKGASLRYKESEGLGKNVIMTLPHAFEDRNPAGVLAICEGPLDALKLDYYGRPFGVRAVATLGVAVTERQIEILRSMIAEPEIRRVWITPDANTVAQTDRLIELLQVACRKPIHFATVLPGYKDVGEYTPQDESAFCKYLSNN